ncbi:MAG: SPOR domain-containing protein [Candidatus Acidiferrum sp.]
MASAGKRGSARERVLEGRHVIGLFMLMLLFSGLFFTLGFVMGRNQYDGQVRAATNLPGFSDSEVQPKREVISRTSKRQPGSDSQTNAAPPANSDWEFYHAGDPKRVDDRLHPVSSSAPAAMEKSPAAAKHGTAASKTSVAPSLDGAGGVNLQVAALTKKSDALALANSLRKKNFPTFVQTPHGDKYYHVLVGPYADQKAVENARKGLEVAGFKAIVKR